MMFLITMMSLMSAPAPLPRRDDNPIPTGHFTFTNRKEGVGAWHYCYHITADGRVSCGGWHGTCKKVKGYADRYELRMKYSFDSVPSGMIGHYTIWVTINKYGKGSARTVSGDGLGDVFTVRPYINGVDP